ncbi:MAG: hypothetical protein IPP47_28080 [Bryobacterales bacterium]|nr:hypothetical protein [Bryobacterales bacterium]
MTVQVAAAPDASEAGAQVRVDGTIGATRVIEEVAEEPLRVAVTTAETSAVTVTAVAVKVAVAAPAATVTEAGVVTKVLLSERATMAPPVGAEAFNVAVQVADPLPVIVDGPQINEDSPTGTATGTVTTPPVAEVVRLSPASETESGFKT